MAGFSSLVLVFATTASLPATPPPPAQAEAQLRAIDRRVLEAHRIHDPGYFEALLGRDFLLTDIDGRWLERDEFLARQGEPAPFERVSRLRTRVRLFGENAVLHGVFQGSGSAGGVVRVRYTNVYAWQDGRWRLVAMQETPIRPKASVAGTAAFVADAPWRGEDPRGDDASVLATLNARYVQAFREADAAWYDAHLAPDYELVSGDGSRLQRAAALSDFAVPYFARHIADFPLDKVRIRRFGELALIHAENAYVLKDGRKGVNRYTDIWMKRGGRWWCVAAHITVREPPG